MAQRRNFFKGTLKFRNRVSFDFRQDFVDFAHDSKEILHQKLVSGAIATENQSRGVRNCIDNISVLLQLSSLKPTVKPLLNLEKYQDPLKVRIAETIINHLKEVAPNEDISQSHFTIHFKRK